MNVADCDVFWKSRALGCPALSYHHVTGCGSAAGLGNEPLELSINLISTSWRAKKRITQSE